MKLKHEEEMNKKDEEIRYQECGLSALKWFCVSLREAKTTVNLLKKEAATWTNDATYMMEADVYLTLTLTLIGHI